MEETETREKDTRTDNRMRGGAVMTGDRMEETRKFMEGIGGDGLPLPM